MRMMSYAQNREDVVLARCFPEATGFYIDVGAANPVAHSVTKWFSSRGWNGVNIEPHHEFFHLIRADRPGEHNVNAAVSSTVGEIVYFEVMNSIGCSTVNPELAEQFRRDGVEVRTHTVKTVTLAQICEQYARGPIDFLKIDAEGHELQVLESMDFQRWKPKVLVIETTAAETWNHVPLANGYQFVLFDGLNRFYLHDDCPELRPKLSAPACCIDDYEIFDHVERVRDLEHALAEARARSSELEGHRVADEYRPIAADWASGAVPRNAYETLLALYRENQRHLEALRRSALSGTRVA